MSHSADKFSLITLIAALLLVVGNANFYHFPGEVTTVFTGIRVLYPDLRETQRIGIKLDVLSTDFLETYQ